MQVRERLDAFTRGRSFKELLLRHTSNHSRGWRCINVSRGITSPDVSISGSQLFIGRAPVSMPSVLSSVIDQLLLLAIQVKTFWEIILEITCYIIIKKKGKKDNGVVEKRRDNSNEILNRLCAILYLQRKTNSNLQLSSIELWRNSFQMFFVKFAKMGRMLKDERNCEIARDPFFNTVELI